MYGEKARGDEETKVLSRNDKAGMIVCRQAYSHIKMRRPKQDFEKELFLLSKAGVDIGTLNHSAIFIDKFRPFLDKTIRLQFMDVSKIIIQMEGTIYRKLLYALHFLLNWFKISF